MRVFKYVWLAAVLLLRTTAFAQDVDPLTQPASTGRPTTEPARNVLPEKNIVFDAPPAGWTQRLFRKVFADSCLEFSSTKPMMNCSIIAEVPSPNPDWKTAGFLQLLLDHVAAKATDFSLVEKKHQTINGIDGIRACARVTINGSDLVFVYWAYACPHGCYQVIVNGKQEDEAEVRDRALAMFDRFHFQDAALANTPVSLPPYHSTRFGYTVDISKPGWLASSVKARDTISPSADFVGSHNNETELLVVPVSLGGMDCDLNAIAKALLQRMKFAFEDATEITPIKVGAAAGISLSLTREINHQHFDYRARVVTANGMAYLVIAWTRKPELTAGLDNVLDCFAVDKTPPPVNPNNLTARERDTSLAIFNALGNLSASQQQFPKAAAWHLHALEMKADPVVVENAVSDYQNCQQPKDALDVTRKYKDQLSKRASLLARAARLEASVGDRDTAIDLYGQLFQTEYDEPGLLSGYCDLLLKAGRADDALAIVQHYRRHRDNTDAAVLEAELQLKRNDMDKALSTLLDRRVRDPQSIPLNIELTHVYIMSKRYPEARANAQVMIDRGAKSAWVYEQLGAAEYYQKSYREAKASFESAIALQPDSELLKNWLRQTSGMLGEGDNSAIKTEISPVPVPAVLLKSPTTQPSFGSDANAVYLLAVNAVSFEKGKEQKTTWYHTIKVLNDAGVDEYSAFRFAFDPQFEEMYVNKLQVKDATGNLLATGNVSDYYTQDSPHEESASFSRTLHIPVPGLKPGCTIDLVVTRKQNNPTQFQYLSNLMSYYRPCAISTLYVCGDLADLRAYPSEGLKQQTLEGGWCWSVPEPQMIHYEPMDADLETYLPMVTLVDSSVSWQQLASDYLETIKDVTKPDADTTALASTLTRGLATDTDRIAAILRYMQSGFTYQAIEFGRRARIPNKAGQVVHNHYGDCKDHALLLHQLLNAAGIPAHLVLVRTRGPLESRAPSMDQFSHMIVCVPSKTSGVTDRYYDCTDKDNDLSTGIPYGLAGKQVLVLDPEHARLETIPAYPSGSSAVSITRDETLDPNGDLTVHEVLTCKGYYAGSMRGSYKRLDPRDRIPAVHDLLAGPGHVDLSIQSASFDNLDHTDQPLIINVMYTLTHRFGPAGTSLVGSLPALLERSVLLPQHVDPRYSPMLLRFPVDYQVTTRLAPADGYRLDQPIDPYHRNTNFETDTVSFTSDKDRTIEELFTGSSIAGQFPPETYGKYERSRLDLVAALEHNIVLTHQ